MLIILCPTCADNKAFDQRTRDEYIQLVANHEKLSWRIMKPMFLLYILLENKSRIELMEPEVEHSTDLEIRPHPNVQFIS